MTTPPAHELVQVDRVVKKLTAWAIERFDTHGPHDARGAALWDAARALDPNDGNALDMIR